ncbi:MAG: hypothetical protein B6D61_14150 [Bacteroidetes bacterium 4484_249]|nr:MAG: hypothetical protein B6D61_14150 [Bacteroidetes bacterium 4484_249]
MKKIVLSFLFSQLIVIVSYAQPGINDNCVNCAKNQISSTSSALGLENKATGEASFASGKLNMTQGDYSTTLGYGNTASGNYSLAGGEESVASKKWAFAFGQRAEADGFRSFAQGMDVRAFGGNSVVIGRLARTLTSDAMIIGYGKDYDHYLENSINSSLMIGFNSDIATLFVGPSDQTGIGKVGIGTSYPTTQLEVNGTFKVTDWSYLKTINLGGYDINQVDEIIGTNGIRFEGVPSTPSQMVLDADGRLGIGTTTPTEKLEVNGNINFTGNLLQNGQPFETSKWTENGSDIFYNVGNVGIGTNSPSYDLDIVGNIGISGSFVINANTPYDPGANILLYGNDHSSRPGNLNLYATQNGFIDFCTNNNRRMRIGPDGNVGINNDIPEHKLDIGGSLRVTDAIYGNTSGSFSKLIIYGSNNEYSPKIEIYKGVNGRSIKLVTREGGSIQFFTNSIQRLQIRDDEIIIGKPEPQYSVDVKVNGHVLAREVEVTPGSWSDYVFNKNYNLTGLYDLENFIAQNGHLPEIPNEEQVMEKGIKIAEMQSLLLKKIEELTLYVIELKKENVEMKVEIEKLKED